MLHDIFIAQSHWKLETPFSLEWNSEALAFTTPNPDSPESYNKLFQIIPGASLPKIGVPPSSVNEIRRFYLQNGKEAREHLLAGTDIVYAVYAEQDPEKATIFLDQGNADLFVGDVYLFNYMALERNLLSDRQIILHSCFVLDRGEAILFTAPSETGKSTQGNHWVELFGSVVANGDRAVLGLKNGIWKAYGSPFSGTSGICKNLQAPVKAIVYLHQAPENHIEEMSGFKAFQLLYEQVTVNNWNSEFQNTVFDLLENLIESVPVYEFWLTKDSSSAVYLKDRL